MDTKHDTSAYTDHSTSKNSSTERSLQLQVMVNLQEKDEIKVNHHFTYREKLLVGNSVLRHIGSFAYEQYLDIALDKDLSFGELVALALSRME